MDPVRRRVAADAAQHLLSDHLLQLPRECETLSYRV